MQLAQRIGAVGVGTETGMAVAACGDGRGVAGTVARRLDFVDDEGGRVRERKGDQSVYICHWAMTYMFSALMPTRRADARTGKAVRRCIVGLWSRR